MRIVALASLVLAGCFGHCGYTPTDAEWQDGALWDAADAPIVPAQGMDVGREHVNLVSVRVETGAHGRGNGDFVYHEGAMRARTESEDGLADAARKFLHNATDLDAEAVEDHVRAFMDSRRPSDSEVYVGENGTARRLELFDHHHVVEIDPSLLLQNLGVAADGPYVRTAPFLLLFDASQKSFDLADLRITVDAFGAATASKTWPEEATDEVILAEIQDALRGAGLPAPREVEVQGVVC